MLKNITQNILITIKVPELTNYITIELNRTEYESMLRRNLIRKDGTIILNGKKAKIIKIEIIPKPFDFDEFVKKYI